MSGGHSTGPVHGERNSTFDQIRRAYWSRPGLTPYPSAVDQLANLRARAESGENLAITDECYPEFPGYDSDNDVCADIRRGRGAATLGGSTSTRLQRNFGNTFASFTRGLVGGGDSGPPVDAAR